MCLLFVVVLVQWDTIVFLSVSVSSWSHGICPLINDMSSIGNMVCIVLDISCMAGDLITNIPVSTYATFFFFLKSSISHIGPSILGIQQLLTHYLLVFASCC